jgi:hypothetical protein
VERCPREDDNRVCNSTGPGTRAGVGSDAEVTILDCFETVKSSEIDVL